MNLRFIKCFCFKITFRYRDSRHLLLGQISKKQHYFKCLGKRFGSRPFNFQFDSKKDCTIVQHLTGTLNNTQVCRKQCIPQHLSQCAQIILLEEVDHQRYYTSTLIFFKYHTSLISNSDKIILNLNFEGQTKLFLAAGVLVSDRREKGVGWGTLCRYIRAFCYVMKASYNPTRHVLVLQ